MKYFAHVPHEGEHLVEQNYVFEVLDREGHRVDKVLVLTTKTAGTNPKSANAVDSSDALIVHPPSTRCRNPGPRPNLATPRQQRGRAERLHRRRRHPQTRRPHHRPPIFPRRIRPPRRGAGLSGGQSTGHRSHSLFRNIGTGRGGTSGPL
ncbi:MAG: hypothetical protein EXS21_10355 [Pedosphaera sp.]|nr:hypothetical protein [Pedosphaera sp.]